jgi:hypothetical protein
VAGRVLRVALAAVPAGAAAALVERVEHGVLSSEERGHLDAVGVEREVHDGALGEDEVGGGAVRAVLLDGVVDVLTGGLGLDLRGGDGDAIEEQGEVEGVVGGAFGVVELAGDGGAVGVVRLAELGGELVGGFGVAEGQLDAEVGDADAKHVDGAAAVELVGDALGDALAGPVLGAVQPDELGPLFGLAGMKERKQFGDVEAELPVVGLGVASVPAAAGEALGDLELEGVLEVRLQRLLDR